MLDNLLPHLYNLLLIVKNYFLEDPLRILYFLGSLAGIHYWINVGRYQGGVSVKVLEERSDAQQGSSLINVKFEICNYGGAVISLEPMVLAKFSMSRSEKFDFMMDLISSDQALPPGIKKAFTFTVKSNEFITLAGLRSYRVAFDCSAPREIFSTGEKSKQIKRINYKLRRLIQK